jgi:diadenosine tetraphosphate (Ap4A) HIT family hydrolase
MQQQTHIFNNSNFYIEVEKSEIPWLKIFPKEPFLELTDMPKSLRQEMWEIYYIVESQMRQYYKPTKINMASFANMLPQVHIHVMARFKEDSYFPNPMWGERIREGKLHLPDEDEFYKRLHKELKTFL